MSLLTRIFLILGTTLTIFYIMNRYRKSNIKVSHIIFWILFALTLFVMSVFPGLLIILSDLFGFSSPINLVFLLVIFVLLGKIFLLSLEIGELGRKLDEFIVRNAEKELEKEENDKK
ncbi:MAG: DUF2304 family protein [Lactovum sp.]